MKTLLLTLGLLTLNAWAIPVLNQNMAAEGTNVTIWPDHQDPDHFYYAPSTIRLAKVGQKAKFHLTKYRANCGLGGIGCRNRGMINALLVADYEQDLLKAQQGILKLRPGARFSTVPMFEGKVKFSNTLRSFIYDHDCSPRSGQPSDEIPCSLTLNNKGLRKLIPFLDMGKVLAFQFEYMISGFFAMPNGEYKEVQTQYGIAVQIGGESLIGHDDLR